MKKVLIIGLFLLSGYFTQAQIRFGFTNPLAIDNWNSEDTAAGVELVVWTPNNDTLRTPVGADVSVIDGSARNNFEFNFPPIKWIFPVGTNLYDSSNKHVLKYHIAPNSTLFGERDFYVLLTGLVGVTTSNLMYNRDMMRVVIDYNGSNVGIKKLDAHCYRLYPMPTNSRLNIEGANASTFKVYDLAGKLVGEGEAMQNSIDVSGLSNGLYVLYAQTERGLIVQKFLKQ